MPKKNLTGKTYGKLTVIRETDMRNATNGTVIWECVCSCGNITYVSSSYLGRKINSCGRCYQGQYVEKDNYMVGYTTDGQEFYFDKEDLNLIKNYIWYSDNGYVMAAPTKKKIWMHRLIMNTQENCHVDHINSKRNDNRRRNLRQATPQQNRWNSKPNKNSYSSLKGVSWDKRGKRFIACICVNNKKINLGSFTDKYLAARIYDEAAKKYFGEYAYLNFA